MAYSRFFAMIVTSAVVMFGLMYLNTYLLSHVFWSETRAYMAVLMGATMAIVMLAFMLSMYRNRAANLAIFAGAAVVFGGSLWLVRSQATVEDTSYMRAMIPHHSIAIMTSSRANISDPRVRKLADEIIYAQDKEIAEMRYLIGQIEASGDAEGDARKAPPRIVALNEALATAEITVLDPEFLTEADIGQAFPEGTSCSFAYTEDSAPVVAIGRQGETTAALVKISGDLVRVDPALNAAGRDGLAFSTDGMALQVTGVAGQELADGPASDRRAATLKLDLAAGLSAGYRGYFRCAG